MRDLTYFRGEVRLHDSGNACMSQLYPILYWCFYYISYCFERRWSWRCYYWFSQNRIYWITLNWDMIYRIIEESRFIRYIFRHQIMFWWSMHNWANFIVANRVIQTMVHLMMILANLSITITSFTIVVNSKTVSKCCKRWRLMSRFHIFYYIIKMNP